MLNRRHKSILFLTLVFTGSSLLAGATLNEALGLLMLGCAFAWVIGSRMARRAYDVSRQLPGRMWGSVRIMLWMALAGGLLASVAVASNFNTFVVCAAMSLFGIFIAPYQQTPALARWTRVVVWILAVAAFLFAAAGMASLFQSSSSLGENTAGRIGELAAKGFVALLAGMLWLVKGWKLIVAGITPSPAVESTIKEAKSTGTVLLYLSMFAGVLLLTLALSSHAFLGFTDAVFPRQGASPPEPQNTTLYTLFGLMLLAWWPYKCWEIILRRQPNNTPSRLKLHKTMTIVLGGVFTAPLCTAVTFGIQNGHDRMRTAEIEQAARGFQAVAEKIGSIKSRDFKRTQDYIEAYAELDPLLTEFDIALKRFDEIIAEADRLDRSRGPLNIQRLYPRHQQWMQWDAKTFDLLHQDSQLTRRQIETIKEMANVPSQQQVAFWKRNVQPLLEQEDEIRAQMASVMKTKPEK